MTLHRLPDEAFATMQVQEAIAVLANHWNAESEKARQARVNRIADWRAHIAACELRAAEYDREASRLPKAHRDFAYYRNLADRQRGLIAHARHQIEIEERGL